MSLNQPLADRIRPRSLDEMVGQTHLFGPRGVLRRMTEAGRIPNMIFFGPPGVGKTTAASIIAAGTDKRLIRLNATTASLADIKEAAAETGNLFGSGGVLLYLDEIQYFNRKQQQSLLEYIEDGRITLIASTTENPHFCLYNALLSRCSLFEFKPVRGEELAPALHRALDLLNADLREGEVQRTLTDDAVSFIGRVAVGDVRRALGLLENGFYAAAEDGRITQETIEAFSPPGIANFDDDTHYDLLSCLQKSIRGSDPDAAVFYLARLLSLGELISVCRRLQVIASEDIGQAYPLAAVVTQACCASARELGMPEAKIPLANAAVLLATAPKSNSAYLAVGAAMEDVEAGRGTVVPEPLASPLFRGYRYPHDYPNHYVRQDYLPADLAGKRYYEWGENKQEQAAKAYWEKIKG
ncbi:MAG: replication-associated recombination protein A [Clostridia bacterium]|nr:replication-associated recombination protein A [Clostridia bacterium]